MSKCRCGGLLERTGATTVLGERFHVFVCPQCRAKVYEPVVD